jgi:putative membrane protein
MEKQSFRQAVMATPGPASWKESAVLAVIGLCMGAANVIPGVSGGTIALIAGIYEKLLAAIKSADAVFVKKLLSFDLKGAIARLHTRFLAVLFFGVAVAIVSLAHVMKFLLNECPEPTYSLFYGLIAASIYVVGKTIKWKIPEVVSIFAGTVAAYFLVGLIPVETPDGLWFIFLCGVFSICAMILPGISGAFILLVLRKYEYIIEALKNPLSLNNMLVIIVFCLGCGAGLIGFSRFFNWLLSKWHSVTLAFLTGLMAGSLRSIWPWKGEAVMEAGKVVSQANVFPAEFGGYFFLCVALMVVGVVLIVVLDRMSEKH